MIYLEADGELNTTEFDLSELVLSVAVAVERYMREFESKPLDDETLGVIQRWFAKVTRENVEERVAQIQVQGGSDSVPLPAKFFASILGMLKRTSTERERVVQSIQKYPAELVGHTNDLLREASRLIGEREFLVVVDNLDRYNPTVIDRCLSAGAEHLHSLDVNLILTPPVSLLLNPHSEPLNNLYQTEFMYTPALRRPTDPPEFVSNSGRETFRAVLSKRLDLDAIFADPDAVLDRVLQQTGGNLRDLMEHLREAIVLAEGPKLTVADIDAANHKRVSIIRDQILVSGKAPLLAKIERAHSLLGGDESLQLLYRRWVLKYNGEEWYALHPYVRAVPEVAELLE